MFFRRTLGRVLETKTFTFSSGRRSFDGVVGVFDFESEAGRPLDGRVAILSS